MKWRKLGLVFCPNGQFEWMHSHAANPLAVSRERRRLRVYFSCRDRQQRSSVGWVEIDPHVPGRILALSETPILSPGPVGHFDDSGVSLGCFHPDGAALRLYYIGWNLGRVAPWRTSIGLACMHPDFSVGERYSPAPIFDRNPVDPITTSYPWVLRQGEIWRMWYGSHLNWGAHPPDSMTHVLRHATSPDGIHWTPEDRMLFPPDAACRVFSRPCVVRDPDLFRMWYSYRTPGYRIGYAVSRDGLNWERRDDEAGLEPTPGAWDGEMISYAHVFDHDQNRYAVYCGNGYGKTGFGLAILEQA